MSADEERKLIDDDKQFYRDMVKELINISKVNTENVKENNKIVQELSLNISELKLSLQNKPCILEKLDENINKGWESATIKTYHYIMGALFTLIAGILAAFGLYK